MTLVEDWSNANELILTNQERKEIGIPNNLEACAVIHANLAFNKLCSIRDIYKCTRLLNLNIMYNSVQSLEGIETLVSLKVLKCSHNHIKELHSLQSCSKLQELWISHNEIEMNALSDLRHVTSLEILVIDSNPCCKIASYKQFLAGLVPSLERIDRMLLPKMFKKQAKQSLNNVEFKRYLQIDPRNSRKGSMSKSKISSSANPFGCKTFENSQMSSEGKFPSKLKREVQQMSISNGVHNEDNNVSRDEDKVYENSTDIAAVLEIHRKAKKLEETHQPESHSEICPSPSKVLTPLEKMMARFPVQKANETNGEECEVNGNQLAEHAISTTSSILDSITGLPQLGNSGKSRYRIAEAQTLNIEPNFELDEEQPIESTHKVLENQNSDDENCYQAEFTEIEIKASPKRNDILENTKCFRQKELIIPYHGMSTSAVHIRADGSAVAKWKNNILAVSVEREKHAFRIFSSYKDGNIAVSFDCRGVGFINFPKGRTMVATTTKGEGTLYDRNGSILRTWDANGVVKDNQGRICSLAEDGNEVFQKQLSSEVGVVLELQQGGINVSVQVMICSENIRHKFVNGINIAEVNDSECDLFFKKTETMPQAKVVRVKKTSHSDFVNAIRAATANL